MGRRVLRRVLRRGSKKGLSRRHLEGRSTPFREYDPLACALQTHPDLILTPFLTRFRPEYDPLLNPKSPQEVRIGSNSGQNRVRKGSKSGRVSVVFGGSHQAGVAL